MKLAHALVLSICFKVCFSVSAEHICKVICSISRFKQANIFVGTLRKPIKLIKILQKECDIKLKMVDDTEKFEETDIISFAESDKENKEILWPLCKNCKIIMVDK